jgi:hypothetical protein
MSDCYWDYRVIRRKVNDEYHFGIHEVYYVNDNIECWSENAEVPFGESLHELREDLKNFSEALEKPILVEKKVDGVECLVEV